MSFEEQHVKFIFHNACFTCQACHTSLAGLPFYSHEDSHMCKSCYSTKMLGVCSACKLPFADSDTIYRVKEDKLHSTCFLCAKCQIPLVDTYIEDNDIYICTVWLSHQGMFGRQVIFAVCGLPKAHQAHRRPAHHQMR